MAVYDEEKKSLYDGTDDYSPESIKNAENSGAESTDDQQKDLLNSLNEDERKLYDSLAEDERDIFLKLKKEEQGLDKAPAELNDRLNSFYKEDSDGGSGKSKSPFSSRGGKKKRIGIIAGAVGVPGLLFATAFIPGLLSIFKLENFLQNIDSATFSRFNASFEGRSDKWIKSYIKLRLTELDGGTNGDTLYFRSSKVDTNNPARDWYRTLRTNKFEQNVFEKNGIRFTSQEVIGPNGQKQFRLAKMTIRDTPIDAKLSDYTISEGLTDRGKIDEILNTLGPDADRFVENELFGSNKEARRAIKTAVNDNTRNWQVFKRRHLRKDIQNMTGIGSWRLFERTRDKLDAKKIDLQNKILKTVLPENRTGMFIGCLFGANKCPGQGDPASPESRDPRRSGADSSDPGTSEDLDENGQPRQAPSDPNDPNSPRTNVASPDGTPGQAADDAARVLSDTANNATDELAGLTPTEKFIQKTLRTVGNVAGNPYSKAWSYLKKIAHIHNTFAENKLGKMVLNATRMQYMAAYATMGMALSQMKSGDIQGTENLISQSTGSASMFTRFANTAEQGLSLATKNGQVSQFMEFFDNAERSEAWILYSAGRAGNSAKALAAEENSDKGRTWYCGLKESDRKNAPVQYLCPEDGLNGGNGDRLKSAYDNSVGILFAPIAAVVNSINSSPIGSVLNFASAFVDRITDATLGPVIQKLLDVTGAGKAFGDIMSAALMKLLEFAGAGIKYFPGKAGQLNYMTLGAASTAESSARLSGGIASTPESLAYSNRLAADWKKESVKNMNTFERFFAISNPESITSKGLMAIATSSPKNILRDAVNPSKGLGNYASLISNAVYAKDDIDINASTAAEWGGVPTYDIPQVCMDLDPLTPDYLDKATNAPEGVSRDFTTLSDSTKFWDEVYANLDGTPDEKEQKAGTIYNCALLDARVMGGLGYLSGYSNDNGLGGSGSTGSDEQSSSGSSNLSYTPASYAPSSDALTKIENLSCDFIWKVNALPSVSSNLKDSAGNYLLNDDGMPKAAFKRNYNNAKISETCSKRKSECLSGTLPSISHKALCEAFKYYSVFYGASYDEHTKKTIDYYGLQPTPSADIIGPKNWVKTWQPGLAGRSFLGCTGLIRTAAYDAYGFNGRSNRVIGVNYEVVDNYKEIRPGDIIWTQYTYPDGQTFGHWVYAASEFIESSGEIVIFHSSGYGTAAGFGIINTTKQYNTNGGEKRLSPYYWLDDNMRKYTKIFRWMENQNAQ